KRQLSGLAAIIAARSMESPERSMQEEQQLDMKMDMKPMKPVKLSRWDGGDKVTADMSSRSGSLLSLQGGGGLGSSPALDRPYVFGGVVGGGGGNRSDSGGGGGGGGGGDC
ncbi:unnamed protein product, partial [Discosporangium mesarthrocarpum]